VIEQLHVFHESLENGIELSEMDLKHGLDALLLHYLVNDRSRQSGGVDQRTANIRTASVHGST